MYLTLHDHITKLEEHIQKQRDRLKDRNLDDAEREHILRHMQIAAIALDSYQRAYELELKLRDDAK